MSIAIELEDVFEKAEQINVYNEGVVKSYLSGVQEYSQIIIEWNKLIDGVHLMPAFGVSLNSETVKTMKNGVWVEFSFNTVFESGGMPYEKLLINVKSDNYGFNIIRYNKSGGYDGRCFYYDLVGKNMGSFYDILLNL